MAKLVFWKNGDKGDIVKKAIETSLKNINEQVEYISNRCVIDFRQSDWKEGKISIDYSVYSKQNPRVDLYVKNGSEYSIVYGGYALTKSGIELQSDITYEGRVIIQ